MKKTLEDLEGAVLRFVADREAVDRRPLREAINEAYQELYERARDVEVTGLEARMQIDLIADQEVYQFPPGVTDLKGIERLDMSTEPVPMTNIPFGQSYRARISDRRGFVILPGGREFRLMQPATATVENGLILWHMPATVKLTDAKQVPLLPEDTHESIVGAALVRVRAWATLKAPKEAEVFMATVAQRFGKFIEPDGRGQLNSLVPSFPFHYANRRRY